ncbi:hypothetical protein ACI2IY_19385 [Lysobacter enzymogenes]|uniref:hypothetical protein n=1 Tax=Lysobacter enzymogenes TaxID=69 RepID=UPI0038505FB9
MHGALPIRAILACTVLALGACATRAGTASLPDPEENTGPLTTRYEVEFDCPNATTFRIAGITQWSDEDDGFRSRITQMHIGRRKLESRWIDAINQRIPAGAYHERPWLTCAGGGAEIEIRFMDRSNGAVAGSPRVMLTLHSDGTLDIRD